MIFYRGYYSKQFCAFFLFLVMLVSSPPPVCAELMNLCVQLKWFHQAQFAGFYLAREKGYFLEQGLDVHLLPGEPKIDWQQTMATGECPIGITNAYEIIRARAEGVPIKAVAAMNQVSPLVFFTLADSDVKNPRQFKGKSLALVPTGKMHFHALMDRIGMSPAEVALQPFSLDMTRLYAGEVDIWSGYVTSMVTKAEKEGHRITVIHPDDYGIQLYDDVIYVRDDFARQNPEAVLGFLRASFRGWQETIFDPEQAVRSTLTFMKNGDFREQASQLARTIPYVHSGEVPIGWMEAVIWDEISRLSLAAGYTQSVPRAETVFTDVFLKKIYPGVQP